MSQTIATLLGQLVIFAGLAISAWTLKRSIKKDREAKLVSDALLAKTVTDLKEKFDKETGGNSGGIREAINNIAKIQKEEVDKSAIIAVIVHELKGAFDERRTRHS